MPRWLFVCAWCLFVDCSHRVELGSDYLAGDAGLGTTEDAGLQAGPVCEVHACEGKIYACGDCVDNDGDNRIDQLDPECLGACDDSEDSYFSAMLGQKDGNCKLDCYFDGDNGSGNDDCHWSHRCDPLSVSPNFAPSGDSQCAYDPAASSPGTDRSCAELVAAQSEACLGSCLPATPSGCDCFGCCELPHGSHQYVWLGSAIDGIGTCDSTSLSDPSRCRPCTPVAGCLK